MMKIFGGGTSHKTRKEERRWFNVLSSKTSERGSEVR